MRPTHPMADRGPQADALADPQRSGYEQFRLDLRRLDKLRADSISLALVTHAGRKRAIRDAITCIDHARAVMDAAIIDDHRSGLPRADEVPETDYDRVWQAYGWLRSSAHHLGIRRAAMTQQEAEVCLYIRERAALALSGRLGQIAATFRHLARKRWWQR